MKAAAVAALLVALLAGCSSTPQPPTVAPSNSAPAPPATEALPNVSLAALDGGTPLNPAELNGIPTVINLWASWCGPCKAELPLLARAHRERADVRIIGIDFADPSADAARRLAATAGVGYRLYADPDSSVRTDLRVVGLPQTVFVDAHGTIVATERRAFHSYADLSTALVEHLGVKP